MEKTLSQTPDKMKSIKKYGRKTEHFERSERQQ